MGIWRSSLGFIPKKNINFLENVTMLTIKMLDDLEHMKSDKTPHDLGVFLFTKRDDLIFTLKIVKEHEEMFILITNDDIRRHSLRPHCEHTRSWTRGRFLIDRVILPWDRLIQPVVY